MFRMDEKIVVYKKSANPYNRTDLRIAGDLGVTEKTLRGWKTDSSFSITRSDQRIADEALQRMLGEVANFPWSTDADNQNAKLYALFVDKRANDIFKTFSFSAAMAFKVVEAVDTSAKKYSQDEWGAALFCYYFYFAISTANTPHDKKLAQHRFALSAAVFEQMIASVTEPWANVMALKVSANRIVESWNNMPEKRRDSPEMKALIDETKYFDKLRVFNALLPHDSVAPFNALAIASRFKARAEYQDLWNRLATADCRYCDPKTVDDPSYLDGDFDDFRLWLDEDHGRAAQLPRKGN